MHIDWHGCAIHCLGAICKGTLLWIHSQPVGLELQRFPWQSHSCSLAVATKWAGTAPEVPLSSLGTARDSAVIRRSIRHRHLYTDLHAVALLKLHFIPLSVGFLRSLSTRKQLKTGLCSLLLVLLYLGFLFATEKWFRVHFTKLLWWVASLGFQVYLSPIPERRQGTDAPFCGAGCKLLLPVRR